jgi:hypothetical protein
MVDCPQNLGRGVGTAVIYDDELYITRVLLQEDSSDRVSDGAFLVVYGHQDRKRNVPLSRAE